MKPLLFALPGNTAFCAHLAQALDAEIGVLSTRHFPDGETYVRFDTAVAQRKIALIATLHRPDEQYLPLAFAAAAAREQGAAQIGLVAPYLAYMRQDTQFQDGEAITSRHFAHWISDLFDWLVTVDPHLHRYAALSEIYAIPSTACHAAPALSAWLAEHEREALLIGPDSESAQWVGAVAQSAGLPWLVLEKIRHGDREVEISFPDIERYRDRSPVLIDDIISSGKTMEAAVARLHALHFKPATCLAVHGLFAEHAFDHLRRAGAMRIVTTNTVPHPAAHIDVSGIVATAMRPLIAGSE